MLLMQPVILLLKSIAVLSCVFVFCTLHAHFLTDKIKHKFSQV